MIMRTFLHLANWRAALLILLLGFSNVAISADLNPLHPADTSSPRATLQGFIEITDEIFLGMRDVLSSYAATDRLYFSAQERRRQIESLRKGFTAIRFMDISQILPVLKDTLAAEHALQLKEILDRIPLPAFTDVPDRQAMASASPKRWRLPGTEIDITLIESGPRAGEYLISADTVGRLPEFYERVRSLPYKPGPAKQLSETYQTISGNLTFAIYDGYSSSPAGLAFIVPPRWMLSLPSWTKVHIAGIAVWQWFALVFVLLVSALFIFGAYRLGRRFAGRGEDEPGPGWHSLLIPLAIIIIAGFVVPVMCKILRIGGSPRIVIAYAETIALFLASAWLAMLAAGLLAGWIVKSERLRPRSLDSQLIRLGARFVGIVVAIALLMHAADDLGFPAFSVLAGLGVGSLAVALAARDSLANLLGSVLIMFEKPFRVGHRIRLSGTEGVVEDVGFRSTRIRTLDNSLISIPNNAIVNANVENLALRTMFRERLVVQVTYDTPRDKLEAFADGIRQLIIDHPTTNKDRFNVHFNDFGESSLNILVIFHLLVADIAAELKEREAVLLKILGLAKEVGVEFAYPTRTLQFETPLGAGGLGAGVVAPFVPRLIPEGPAKP